VLLWATTSYLKLNLMACCSFYTIIRALPTVSSRWREKKGSEAQKLEKPHDIPYNGVTTQPKDG